MKDAWIGASRRTIRLALGMLLLGLAAYPGQAVAHRLGDGLETRVVDWGEGIYGVEISGSVGARNTSVDGRETVHFWWDDQRLVRGEPHPTRVAAGWDHERSEGFLALRETAAARTHELDIHLGPKGSCATYYIDGTRAPLGKMPLGWAEAILFDLECSLSDLGGANSLLQANLRRLAQTGCQARLTLLESLERAVTDDRRP